MPSRQLPFLPGGHPASEVDRLIIKLPGVWAADNPPGLAMYQAPDFVELLPGASPVCHNRHLGHREQLYGHRILVKCKSAWNSPLLPIRKPSGEYRPVQDLRAVNKTVGKRELGSEQKQAVCTLPTPTTQHHIREFLGVAGFCRAWIPNFPLIAKPLCEATKRGDKEPFLWETNQAKAFKEIKRALIQAPALGLPDQTAFLLICR
ncbi:hypothetical protein AAY473_036280 [Plecturocebus cupreus]